MSSSGSGTSATYTTNIPEWAKQPFMDLVGKADALSQAPYQAYTGERIAGFSPLQQQAQQAAGAQTASPYTAAGAGLAGAASVGAMGAGAGFTPAQTGQFAPQASAYMSPYMQQVVAAQQREATRQADIAGTQRAGEATKMGAFGGGRQAIVEAEAQRNLATQLGDIQTQGLQSAYEQAQKQFNTEQALAEQSRQYGAGLGLQGFQTALQGAQTMGGLGQQLFGQQMDVTKLQSDVGQQQQALAQKQLEQQYADFQTQQNYPYQQLGFLSDILRGVQGSTRTMYSSAPQTSPLQTIAGLGTAASAFMAEGGSVPSPAGLGAAVGGAAPVDVHQLPATLEQMSDQGLQQFTQMYREDPYTLALAASEAGRRKRLRNAAQSQPAAQGTVADEVVAEMVPPMPAGLSAARGYADGGNVDLEKQRAEDRAGVARFGRAVWEQMRNAGAAIADVATLPLRGVVGAYDTAVVRPMRAAGVDAAYLSPLLVPEGANVESMTPFYDQYRQPAAPVTDTGDQGARLAARYPAGLAPAAGAEALPVAPAGAGLADGADAVLPPARSDTVRTSAGAVSRGGPGASSGAPTLELGDTFARARTDAQGVTDAAKAAAAQDTAEALAAQAARGKLGEAREQRLKEQQAGLETKGAQAKRDALLQAGFAILSADPSKGAWSAIGTGALQGLQGYKGDMADLAKHREALLDKLDELDTLRRQEASADASELRQLRSRERQVNVEGAKLLAQIGGEEAKAGLDLKVAAFKELSANYRMQQENAVRLQASRIAAAAGSRNQSLETAQAYARSAGVPLHQALQEIAQGKQKPVDAMAGFNEWLSKNPQHAMGDPAKAVSTYLATQGALRSAAGVRVTDKPSGTVLER